MAAPEGNNFWQGRASHGRNLRFATPDDIWNACCEYFDWVEANPLMETLAFSTKDGPTTIGVRKMRAMTIVGLCAFLDISRRTYAEYRKRAEFIDTVARVDAIIWTQKFQGAAAGLLNANIVARELGLADKSERSGPGVGAVRTETITRIELVPAPHIIARDLALGENAARSILRSAHR